MIRFIAVSNKERNRLECSIRKEDLRVSVAVMLALFLTSQLLVSFCFSLSATFLRCQGKPILKTMAVMIGSTSDDSFP